MRCSAVILAGGYSRRMGRDKARLLLGGEPLLLRTARLARETGASPLFLSCRKAGDYALPGALALPDRHPGNGPLEGIATALEQAPEGVVLVLAVDLPALNVAFLSWLWAQREGAGVIPQLPGGLEPLAALYPTGAARLARERLTRGERSARAFAAAACREGWCTAAPVPERLAAALANWNRPDDWPPAIDAAKPPHL